MALAVLAGSGSSGGGSFTPLAEEEQYTITSSVAGNGITVDSSSVEFTTSTSNQERNHITSTSGVRAVVGTGGSLVFDWWLVDWWLVVGRLVVGNAQAPVATSCPRTRASIRHAYVKDPMNCRPSSVVCPATRPSSALRQAAPAHHLLRSIHPGIARQHKCLSTGAG